MANKIERDIFVLRDASCVAQPIEYVQGTNAVPVLLHIRDYEIPKNSTARVYVEWPSGKGEYDADGVTISGNDVLIQPKSTLFSEIGKCSMQVCIKNGTKTLVTFSHPVMVRKNMVPGITDPSQNHSDFLDEYINKMTEATDSANEASERANEIADKADSALEAIKQASQGTLINDEAVSNVTTYSSEKIEEGLSLMDIQHSTSNDLYKTENGGLRMVGMKGNTEQGSLTGKNKLNYDAWKKATITRGTAVFENNGVTLTATETDAYTDFITEFASIKDLNEGDVIRLSWEEDTDDAGLIYIFPNGDTTKSVSISNATTKRIKYTVPSGVTYITFRFGVVNPSTTISYKNIMITINDDDPTFEKWCGGIPAPNPQYRIPIENTFDSVEMMQGYYSITTGAYGTTPEAICSKYPIPCNGGDVVKVVTETIMEAIYIMYYGESGYISYSKATNAKEHEFTLPNGATSFNIRVDKTPITPSTVGKITLTVNGKYVGQIVEHGKNLVPFKKTYTNSVTDTRTWLQLSLIYYFTDGTNTTKYFTTSSVKVGNYNVVVDLPKDMCKVVVKHNGAISDIIFDTIFVNIPKGTYMFSFCVDAYNPTIVGGIKISDIQLEEGTEEATDYEPYTEHVATFYTDEPIRKGDVIFKDEASRLWQIERNVAERAIADMYIVKLDDGYQTENTNLFTASIASKKYPSDNVWCSHFSKNSVFSYNCDVIGMQINSANSQMYFRIGQQMTADEFKTWCNENDVKIQYELATSTIETLDTASQIALNGLKTFNDATHVEVNSKIKAEECEWEFGTSQTSARLIASELENDIRDIKIARLEDMLLSLGGNA